MPAPSSARLSASPHALALGLILPLALVGAASAQQGAAPPSSAPQSSWVDPPARPAAAAPDAAKRAPRASARDAIGGPVQGTVREAVKPAPEEDALPKAASTPAASPKRGFASGRPESGEAAAPRPRAPQPRRLAEMPAAVGVMPVAAASSGRAAAARALAATYLATVSRPGATMVGAAHRFYGTRVRFYGRSITLAGLVAEKRSFVRRWPDRRYEPRMIRTACDAQTCTVRAIVDFRAASPDRGAVSRGAAELVLEVSFSGPHPIIVAETGRVLRRGAQAGMLAPVPGKA